MFSHKNRLIIGITGGIASGKSIFNQVLKENGFSTISADEIVKKISEKDKVAYKEIIKLGTGNITDSDGNIDRDRLRKLVFEDESLRKKIEKIVHPIVIKKIDETIRTLPQESPVAIEIPLLFEAGLEKLCSYTVTIFTPKAMMLQRLRDRYGIKDSVASKMLDSHMDIACKMLRSDFIIFNTGTVEELKDKARVFAKILSHL